jgi:Mg-chelatase subunit ChlD
VIGSSPLTVGKVTASVSAPSEVTAGEPFEVTWEGPGNPQDYVTIVSVGTPDGEYGPYGYTKRGNPVRVQAPRDPGVYVVRYQTGQSNRVLATATSTTTVVAGASTGRLRIQGGGDADSGRPAGAVEVILDASGSMLQRIGNRRRIELAREALVGLTGSALPEGVPFALRVFGHREAGSCRTDLEIPLTPLNRAEAAARIQSVESKNLAKTPIAASLAKVREDLAGVDGPHLVILVTDGEETCDGDPAAAIDALRNGGIEVRVNIVGFAIGDLATREDFERWARRGGGSYTDASNGEDLARAVREALRPPFEVLANGEVVATGIVDGQPLELPVGRYEVRLLSSPARDLGSVEVTADEEVSLTSN